MIGANDRFNHSEFKTEIYEYDIDSEEYSLLLNREGGGT